MNGISNVKVYLKTRSGNVNIKKTPFSIIINVKVYLKTRSGNVNIKNTFQYNYKCNMLIDTCLQFYFVVL